MNRRIGTKIMIGAAAAMLFSLTFCIQRPSPMGSTKTLFELKLLQDGEFLISSFRKSREVSIVMSRYMETVQKTNLACRKWSVSTMYK